MTETQLDLFGEVSSAETDRIRGVLLCLRDSIPEAMTAVIHLRDWHSREIRSIGMSGAYAYTTRHRGIYWTHVADWAGWDDRPRHLVTWDELAEHLAADPRRADLITWHDSLEIPNWQQLTRPFELWPNPDQWHPNYITGDHERTGWSERLSAWTTLRQLLADAASSCTYDIEEDTL